ncbi:MAG TPA: adenylate/guanylate cyclase domain-containing protein [Candidatus Methylacidiphilales bacterium]|jgi:adenylate cyclase|nr:adenylate/guanylate cyclase domain-containing protein [Candidatus Methylacidiphilales bacterium]
MTPQRFLRLILGKLGFVAWGPVVALALVYCWNLTPLSERLEYMSLNLRFLARAPFDPPVDPRLVLVGIDQPTLDHLGAWPWPRNQEADFINTIAASGMTPNVLAFDILLTDDFDKFHVLQLKSGKDFDQMLGDAAGQLPSVVTGAFWMAAADTMAEQEQAEAQTRDDLKNLFYTVPYAHIEGDILRVTGSTVAKFPVAPLRKQSFFGFVNADPDAIDGIRHEVPMLVRVNDEVFPSLSLQVLCQMLNVDPDKVRISLGHQIVLTDAAGKSWTIPINEKGQVVVNYRNTDAAHLHNLSFYKLFTALYHHANAGEPLPPECDIDKKTLLVAGSAIGLADLGTTPLGVNVPLGVTHLNVINNVLRHDFISNVPRYWVMLGWLLAAWLTLYEISHASIARAILWPNAIAILYTALAFALFGFWSIQIDLVWPLLAFAGVASIGVTLRWQKESQGRDLLKKTFAQMVSPDLMNYLIDHPDNLKLGGSKRAVTILFSDIRGYTTLSEGTDSVELVRQLNCYFDRMVRGILDHRGTLHGFTGDGIMAVWGDVSLASSGPELDALNAVRSALRMRRDLVVLNEEREREHLPPLRIGIGLNHGPVVVGQMGASIRTQFSCVGDTVNTAARIEGATKTFQTDLAIGEDLRELLGDTFLVRRLAKIQLKGKQKAIFTYEVLAESNHPELSAWHPEEVTQYEAALDCFLNRRFKEAEGRFLACLDHHPKDYCCNFYLDASRRYNSDAPSEEWDGRVVMETK